jgi:hypothetical protein
LPVTGKCTKLKGKPLSFCKNLCLNWSKLPKSGTVILCAPFTALDVMSKSLHNSRVQLGAQNIHWEDEGAYTGEISGSMLTEIGVRYVIVGHSERRQYFGETDETVNQATPCCSTSRFDPILCVGETKQQRDAGETESIISTQLSKDLVDVDQAESYYRLRTDLGNWYWRYLRGIGSQSSDWFDSESAQGFLMFRFNMAAPLNPTTLMKLWLNQKLMVSWLGELA